LRAARGHRDARHT